MFEEDSYRVELEQFSGPMDLLLHLVHEEELAVGEIEVARICDRFVEHLEGLDRIDIDAAGDFLVMASTLMRMKSRSLLPAEEQVLEDDDLDPRFELVRQLIQYRRFKRVAEILEERRELAARRFARGMHPENAERPEADAVEVVLDGTGVELLFSAFARLLRETKLGRQYVVTVDDTSIEQHIERVQGLLPPGARLGFRELVPRGSSKAFVIGVFLALLELLKLGHIEVRQDVEFGAIEVAGCVPDPARGERMPPAAVAGPASPPEACAGAAASEADVAGEPPEAES